MNASDILRQLHGKAIPYQMTDPGDGNAIAPDRQFCAVGVMTGATGETNTLSDPTYVNQQCMIYMLEDGGGDRVITAASGIDEAGTTIFTLGDEGDFVYLVGVVDARASAGSYTYAWRVVGSSGVAEATAVTGDLTMVGDLSVTGTTALTGALSSTGATSLATTAQMTAGTGITTGTGTVCEHTVIRIGDLIKTEILVDVTGLNDGDTSGDVIGKDGDTANCHIGQITDAVNGAIVCSRLTCLEVPAGGDVDIDLWHANEDTLAQDTAISAATGEAVIHNNGDLAAGTITTSAVVPTADDYLYLVTGSQGTDADYTGGIILIEFWGTPT